MLFVVDFIEEIVGKEMAHAITRWAIIGIGLVTVWIGWKTTVFIHDEKVKASVVSDINAKGEKTRADAIQARANAESASDPVARLRAGFCRDCKPDVLNPKASNRQ